MATSSTDIPLSAPAAREPDRGESVVSTAAGTFPRGEVKPLSAMTYGVGARVVAVEGDESVSRRLMEMGVVPGAPVCLIKAAPLGDPLEVRVRGYHLALRRSEAQTILVAADDQ